jgi:hypothetical protein
MAAHATRNAIACDGFQWLGGTLSTSAVVLPYWAKALALHSPGDGSLHVPCPSGTDSCQPNSWVVRFSDGAIEILSNAMFTAYFT